MIKLSIHHKVEVSRKQNCGEFIFLFNTKLKFKIAKCSELIYLSIHLKAEVKTRIFKRLHDFQL